MKTKQELFMEEFRKEVKKEKIRQEKQKEYEYRCYRNDSIDRMDKRHKRTEKSAYFVANNRSKKR